MRGWIALGMTSFLLGAAVLAVAWQLTERGQGPGAGKVVANFEPGPAADEQIVRAAFAQTVENLDSELGLNHDVQLRVVGQATAASVGAAGPLYEPHARTIYIPWTYVEQARGELRAARRSGSITGPLREVLARAMSFVLYHEAAHAAIDQLDVPSTGGEEGDADSLGTILAIASGSDGQAIALAASELFASEARQTRDFAGHAAAGYDLPHERDFDLRCLVYGSNPVRNAGLVGGERRLTPDQAKICVFDYRREVRSWRRLLAPHLRHAGALSRPIAGRATAEVVREPFHPRL